MERNLFRLLFVKQLVSSSRAKRKEKKRTKKPKFWILFFFFGLRILIKLSFQFSQSTKSLHQDLSHACKSRNTRWSISVDTRNDIVILESGKLQKHLENFSTAFASNLSSTEQDNNNNKKNLILHRKKTHPFKKWFSLAGSHRQQSSNQQWAGAWMTGYILLCSVKNDQYLKTHIRH